MKNRGRRAWIITTSVVLVLLIVLNTAAVMLFDLLNIVMPGGGMRALYADGVEASYVSDFASKEEALENANAVNVDLCREGFVLLKNENNALPIATPESDSAVTERPKISVFGKNSVNLAYGGSGSGGGGNVVSESNGTWVQDAKGWWYRRADGTYPANKWEELGGKWYFFDENGYMKTGWIDWEGKSYYCSENGDMLTNCMTPDNYLVGEDGAWIAQ